MSLPNQLHLCQEQLTSSRQCVFRCGNSWFSVPATSLRSVTMGTNSYLPPNSPCWLNGIVHLQSEFIPVVSITALLDRQHAGNDGEARRLLIFNGNPVWAIRADEVASLTDVEASLSPGYQLPAGQHSGVVGTFTWRSNIARVLEPHNLLSQIQRALHEFWNPVAKEPSRSQGQQSPQLAESIVQ